MIPAAAGVVSGRDPRHGNAPFVNQIFMMVTAGAATPTSDAWLTTFHVGGAGMLRRDSVEVAERRHPLRVHVQRLLADTEGAGTYRGAPSAYVEYGPVETTLFVAYGADGAVNAAQGARGGLPGAPCRHLKRTHDGDLEELPSLGIVELHDGERMVSVTCGGGGCAPPNSAIPRWFGAMCWRVGSRSSEHARSTGRL